MPRLKLPERAQQIYEELVESAGGARMLALRNIAQYLGRDDRSARKWVQGMGLAAYEINGIKRYSARDVAMAIYNCEV